MNMPSVNGTVGPAEIGERSVVNASHPLLSTSLADDPDGNVTINHRRPILSYL